MKRTIVFDFDGVLVDSVELKGSAFSQVLEILDTNVSDEIAEHHLSNPSMGREEKLLHYMSIHRDHIAQGIQLPEALSQFSRQVISSLSRIGLMDGCRDFLAHFSATHDLQICSSAPDWEITEILSNLGVLKYFSKICGPPTKKDEFLLECSKVSEGLIFIGDSMTDLVAAERANVEFIGYRLRGETKCTRIIHTFSELPQAINEIEMRNL